jgi:chaperone modulatory protein CbpM
MRTFQEVVAAFETLDATELQHWIEEHWILPAREGETYVFSEVDVARVTLIQEMRSDLGVGAEAIPLVLSLLDQAYAMREQVRALTRAIEAQPDETRKAIEAFLKDV